MRFTAYITVNLIYCVGFSTGRETVKGRYVRRDPRVSFDVAGW
jgi:hypothetical protein